MRLKLQISVILATYNRTDALALVLQSLDTQTDKNFEVVIADDGSREDTKFLIEQFRRTSRLAIQHVWHEDHGFRLAKIRNLAIASSTGDYLIFLDGDCITQPDFIARHQTLKEQNFLVTGSRILLGKKLQRIYGDHYLVDYLAKQPNGTQGYLMNRHAAKTLLGHTSKMIYAIDESIDREWEHRLRMRGLEPAVLSHNDFASTIGKRINNKKTLAGRFVREYFRMGSNLRKQIWACQKRLYYLLHKAV